MTQINNGDMLRYTDRARWLYRQWQLGLLSDDSKVLLRIITDQIDDLVASELEKRNENV